MTLREMMIERIYMAMTEEDLQEGFDTCEDELRTMPDDEFLDLYEEIVDTLLGF
jgi:hypothetical protein